MKLTTKHIFIFIFNIFLTNSVNLRVKNSLKQDNFYSSDRYETPQIIHHETPYYVHSFDDLTHRDQYINPHSDNSLIQMNPNHFNDIHHLESIHQVDDCLCSSQVRCHPCGEIITHVAIDCPCAPKINCPICPPLSLIHEIAAKKARDDQKLAYDLQNISTQISTLLRKISKFAGDVVKAEIEAKTAARNMEEASLKAQYARREMIEMSEKAKFIATTTITNHPCGSMDCPPIFHSDHIDSKLRNILNTGPTWYGSEYNKIFPEEVGSIKEYTNQDSFRRNRNINPIEKGEYNEGEQQYNDSERNDFMRRDLDHKQLGGNYRKRDNNKNEESKIQKSRSELNNLETIQGLENKQLISGGNEDLDIDAEFNNRNGRNIVKRNSEKNVNQPEKKLNLKDKNISNKKVKKAN